jgi:hypothetical protein
VPEVIIDHSIAGGQGSTQAGRFIRNRFAAWRRNLQPDAIDMTRRTVEELLQNAEKARQIRLEKEKQDRRQREIKRREKRKPYLKDISSDFPKARAWVRGLVERGTGQGYDEACRIIKEYPV